jgi:hypothetical protein
LSAKVAEELDELNTDDADIAELSQSKGKVISDWMI